MMNQPRTVTARFSLKPGCLVPKLKGKTVEAAKRALRRAHCRTGKISHRYSQVKRNHVISQKPRPRRRLPIGTKVNLVVSKGRRP